jgi:TatA/E family protein of Tat protein translocase
MFYGLGMQELLVILAIAMLLFGGKKLPEVGRNLGKAIRGFKQAEDEATQEIQEAARNAKTAETEDPAEETAAADTAGEGDGSSSDAKAMEDQPGDKAEEEQAEKPA